MKNKAISKIAFGIILLFAVTGAIAQENAISAIIREISGTVELQRSGSTNWENAVQGQTLSLNTLISTGFRSNAIIAIGDSRITVRPLTRLSLAELSESPGTETINASLHAGRARVEVKPPAGTRASVTVQTPVATASVRGTVFELGLLELRVIEGTVEYTDSRNIPVIVSSGGRSQIEGKTGRLIHPIEIRQSSLYPAQPIANDSFSSFEVDLAQGGNGVRVSPQITYKE